MGFFMGNLDTVQKAQKINCNFKGKDILSLDQFSPEDLEILFSITRKMKIMESKGKTSDILAKKMLTLIFYEPSSRTFGSFCAAIKKLGGQTVEIQNPTQVSSVAKGETLEDTIRVFEAYSDAIIIRHPIAGTAKAASDAAFFIPIINAGDGTGEHPTQALLDLFTIKEQFHALKNLTVLFAGDMLNGRTVHSVLRGLSLFKGNSVYLLSPPSLRLTRADFTMFSQRGLKLIEINHESQIPKEVHVWYWTRVQKERFSDLKEYEKLKNTFTVTKKLLEKYANKNMILMHPLPRVVEIDREVDKDPRALYFRSEIRNGMYTRMALLALVLGKIS